MQKRFIPTNLRLQQFPLFLIVFLGLSLLLAACSPEEEAAPTPTVAPEVTLTGSGSGSVSTLLTAIKPAFETANPGHNLNILSGSGTGGGVTGVLEGILDVAAMARVPKDEETAGGLQYMSFGGSAVAILLNPDVEVTDLTQDQVRAIFFGEITNWSEVGGQDLAIVVYVRDEDESATGLLRQVIFGDIPFPETVAGVLTSSADMISTIESTPASIGFVNWTAVVAAESPVKAANLDGFATTDPAYPVILSLGIGFVEDRREMVQPLADWLLSEQGQTALRELGVISPASS